MIKGEIEFSITFIRKLLSLITVASLLFSPLPARAGQIRFDKVLGAKNGWVTPLTWTKSRLLSSEITSTKFGYELRIDENTDGRIDVLIVSSGRLTAVYSESDSGKFNSLVIKIAYAASENQYQFKLSLNRLSYDLHDVRTTQVSDHRSAERGVLCQISPGNNLEQIVNLWNDTIGLATVDSLVRDPAILSLVDSSCGDKSPQIIQGLVQTILSPNNTENLYGCATKAEISGGERASENTQALGELLIKLRERGNVPFIRCAASLPRNDRGVVENGRIELSLSSLRSSSQDQVTDLVFHETLHPRVKDPVAGVFEKCCGLSASDTERSRACANLKRSDAGAPEDQRFPMTSPAVRVARGENPAPPVQARPVPTSEGPRVGGRVPAAGEAQTLAAGNLPAGAPVNIVAENQLPVPAVTRFAPVDPDNQADVDREVRRVEGVVAATGRAVRELDTSLIPRARAAVPARGSRARTTTTREPGGNERVADRPREFTIGRPTLNGVPTLINANGASVAISLPIAGAAATRISADGSGSIDTNVAGGGEAVDSERRARLSSRPDRRDTSNRGVEELGSNFDGSGADDGISAGAAGSPARRTVARPSTSGRGAEESTVLPRSELIQRLTTASDPRSLLREEWFISDLVRSKTQIRDGTQVYGYTQGRAEATYDLSALMRAARRGGR